MTVLVQTYLLEYDGTDHFGNPFTAKTKVLAVTEEDARRALVCNIVSQGASVRKIRVLSDQTKEY